MKECLQAGWVTNDYDCEGCTLCHGHKITQATTAKTVLME